MNISHSSVSFHILNCLSVIGGKRERDDLTQSPTFLHLSFCLLVWDYQLSPLSHRDWQLKIIAFIMCGVFIPSSSVFFFMREQKMLSAVSLFISSIGRLMKGTVLSQAFCDRLQSLCTGGLFVCTGRHSHSHCDSSLDRLGHDQKLYATII